MLCRSGVVRDGHHVFALAAEVAKRADCRSGILHQPVAKRGIAPGAGDNMRAVAGADPCLVGFDQNVERGRIDIALLDQDRFERPHTRVGLRQIRTVIVVVIV